MLAQELVTEALYLSRYDRQLQPAIDGGVTAAALNTLNIVFDTVRDLIPYSVEYTFNDVNDLLDTQFVQVDNVSFVIPGSPKRNQYQLIACDLTRFVAEKVILDLKALPAFYYFDPLKQNIDVYPLPTNQTYAFIVWGRTQIGPLTAFSSIPFNVPKFMIQYLIYELASQLALEAGVPFNEKKEKKRAELLAQLKSKRETPLSTPARMVFGPTQAGGIPPYPWFYKLSGGP
jgi:hypothetical protein